MFAPVTDLISFIALSVLLQQSLYAAILLLPALALAWLLRRSSPYILMAIWLVVMARMIVPPGYYSQLSLRSALEGWLFEQSIMDSLRTIDSFVPWFSTPLFQQFPYLTWNVFGLLCWLLPSVWMVRRLLKRRADYFKLANASLVDVGAGSDHVLALVAKWRHIFTIRRRVRLVISAQAQGPFTVGSWRPKVVLPVTLVEQLSEAELEAVIAHEMAHVSRFDDMWLSTEQWLSCIFFFHPAIWLCRSAMHRFREMICDRLVLASKEIPPRIYAQSLLAVIELCQQQSSRPSVSGMIGTYEECRQRIERMQHHRQAKVFVDGWLLFTIIAFSLLVILPMAPVDKFSEADKVAPITGVPAGLQDYTVSPITGGVLGSRFGPREFNKTFDIIGGSHHLHTGVDIYAAKGTPIVAMLDGEVIKAMPAYSDEMSMFRGGYVMIRHGGIQGESVISLYSRWLAYVSRRVMWLPLAAY
ncbi:M56 family metallopeptidase [Oceanicoccus sp. KOV_DT_Chl]|uniref:M56 family metallopeptidase n=1 Tax=Oceanicoccus sp. KOV_DT_Chl TaxID=1904639 RepID=UPI000C7B2253|nr:M56 family metallopeptidase [Oceanicoccus sp. KOV_DT_Chl]